MSILDNENIILSDNSYIINEIKQWFAYNVADIRININLNNFTATIESLFGPFGAQGFTSSYLFWHEGDAKKEKYQRILNIDDEQFSKFIQINTDIYPAHVVVNGDMNVSMVAKEIPTKLFVIDKIKGNLNIAYCEFETTNGYPDRRNIEGQVDYRHSKIKHNKYLYNTL